MTDWPHFVRRRVVRGNLAWLLCGHGSYVVEYGGDMDDQPMLPLGPEGMRILRERMPNPMVYKHGPGPEGKRCKTCRHVVSIRPGQNRYWKCDRRSLSHSQTSDHRLKWPACRLYEEEP